MTAREFIAELGGYRAAGRILEVNPYTVRGWRDRNRIPVEWFDFVRKKTGVIVKAGD